MRNPPASAALLLSADAGPLADAMTLTFPQREALRHQHRPAASCRDRAAAASEIPRCVVCDLPIEPSSLTWYLIDLRVHRECAAYEAGESALCPWELEDEAPA
jgi:hypothetical protein